MRWPIEAEWECAFSAGTRDYYRPSGQNTGTCTLHSNSHVKIAWKERNLDRDGSRLRSLLKLSFLQVPMGG